MSINIIRGSTFTAPQAWGALDIANMNGITVRLHWPPALAACTGPISPIDGT